MPLERTKRFLHGLYHLPEDLAQTYARVRELQMQVERIDAIQREPLPREPFVCVLIEGSGPRGPTTMGATGRVRSQGLCVELRCQVAMHSCRLTVFADLEKVNVGGVFVGNDYMHSAVGECPVAFIHELVPGAMVRVQATLRQPSKEF